MAETFLIRLSEQDNAPVSWLVLDSAGAPLGAVQTAMISEASAAVGDRRVVALIPGVEVLLTEPELPVRGGARLAQVVPFALEEQLADDVEDMHFAIGKRDTTDEARPGTPVAVVSRERLDHWLALLRGAGLNPEAVYADSMLLPANPSQTVLLIEGNRLFVGSPHRPALVLQAEPLSTALELAGIFPQPDATAETHVLAYLSEAGWQAHGSDVEAVRERFASLNVQLLPEGALPLFAQQLALQPPFNILQGPYAAKSEFKDAWRRWRLAAGLFGALIAMHLLAKGIELWRLKHTERELDAAITEIFQQAMPGEKSATDARRRMESRLSSVRSGGSADSGLLTSMSVLGSAFSQVPQTTLDALSFRGDVLDLRVAARDVSSLDRLQNLISQQGLTAELQSSNPKPSGVEGRLQIRSKGT